MTEHPTAGNVKRTAWLIRNHWVSTTNAWIRVTRLMLISIHAKEATLTLAHPFWFLHYVQLNTSINLHAWTRCKRSIVYGNETSHLQVSAVRHILACLTLLFVFFFFFLRRRLDDYLLLEKKEWYRSILKKWIRSKCLFITTPKSKDSQFSSTRRSIRDSRHEGAFQRAGAGSSHCSIRVTVQMARGQFVLQINFAWQQYNVALLEQCPECTKVKQKTHQSMWNLMLNLSS